jgi:lipopolysaccharide transport system permease protein
LAHVIETFRFSWTGTGSFTYAGLFYSFVCMVVLLFAGIALFNKVESTFMDNV